MKTFLLFLKNKCFYLPFYILFIVVLSSCSIQKRHYLKGYYVDWNNQIGKKSESTQIKNLQTTESEKEITAAVKEKAKEKTIAPEEHVTKTVPEIIVLPEKKEGASVRKVVKKENSRPDDTRKERKKL